MKRWLALVLCAIALGGCESDDDEPSSRGTPAPQSTTQSGRARVTGTMTALRADAAEGPPLAPPFTITVPERGRGGVEVPRATVAGRDVTIVWTTGRPLPVTGAGGGLDLGRATVVIDAAGITWTLDGEPRAWLPGTYTFGSSVAVGSRGLSRPEDRVTFTVRDGDGLTSSGGAMVRQQPGELRIQGATGVLRLEGRLRLETAPGERQQRSVELSGGTYVVELVPVSGGYRVIATLEGRITAS